MANRDNDTELFATLQEELYTPVVGDVLDQLGCYRQFLPCAVQPIENEMKVVGRAMPSLHIDVYGPQQQPFGKLTEALDQLEQGEVWIGTGGLMRCAYWGEILTAAARGRGATGAVINGYHRDTPKVLTQNWPLFSRGTNAQDSRVRTQVVDYRCPVEIENVSVDPGDLVFGDIDGVVVIPQQRENEVIKLALEKVRAENVVRREIERGMTCTEAFRTYGVL